MSQCVAEQGWIICLFHSKDRYFCIDFHPIFQFLIITIGRRRGSVFVKESPKYRIVEKIAIFASTADHHGLTALKQLWQYLNFMVIVTARQLLLALNVFVFVLTRWGTKLLWDYCETERTRHLCPRFEGLFTFIMFIFSWIFI